MYQVPGPFFILTITDTDIKSNTKTRSQGETLSTRLSLGPVFEFSRDLAIVTDDADHMSLQILELPPQPISSLWGAGRKTFPSKRKSLSETLESTQLA